MASAASLDRRGDTTSGRRRDCYPAAGASARRCLQRPRLRGSTPRTGYCRQSMSVDATIATPRPTARPTRGCLDAPSAGPVDCRQSTTCRGGSASSRRVRGRRLAQPSQPVPSLRQGPRGRRSQPGGPGRRLRDAPRPVRLREEHDAEPGRRPRRAECRDDPPRRSGRHEGAAQRAADGDGLPELRPLPEHDRLREHRILDEAPSAAGVRGHRACHRGGRDARHRDTCCIASRRSCPAASSSASRSGEPSSSSPWSSCSTNRSATSTPRSGPGCAPRSSTSTSRWGRRASS